MDDRLRALERELLRGGKTLKQWAMDVLAPTVYCQDKVFPQGYYALNFPVPYLVLPGVHIVPSFRVNNATEDTKDVEVRIGQNVIVIKIVGGKIPKTAETEQGWVE